MNKRTIRIEDEMIDRGSIAFNRTFGGGTSVPCVVQAIIEAALGDLLERRNGDRRAPTLKATSEQDQVVKPAHRRKGETEWHHHERGPQQTDHPSWQPSHMRKGDDRNYPLPTYHRRKTDHPAKPIKSRD